MRPSCIPAEVEHGSNTYDYSLQLKFGKSEKKKFFLKCLIT